MSIIKSGPSEIAGEAIAQLLSAHAADGQTGERATAGPAKPVLTFQVGLPLGPDEMVCPGQSDEHLGLKERLLDKRATRARLAQHHIPAPDQE